jgi:hypothetical protein
LLNAKAFCVYKTGMMRLEDILIIERKIGKLYFGIVVNPLTGGYLTSPTQKR